MDMEARKRLIDKALALIESHTLCVVPMEEFFTGNTGLALKEENVGLTLIAQAGGTLRPEKKGEKHDYCGQRLRRQELLQERPDH